ncbi:MAG: DegV family protein [Lachnospiraceae bacterium]|nr:DegV family protein [Lachnospiraceae bacterium]
MAKVAIVTDSNSGITQKEAKKLGVFVLPMPFTVDNETYFEDINLTQEDFYEKLKGDADICTSQPSPDAVMKLWDKVLKEYDEILHIPMSSGLSGSCQTAMMLAQDYDEKVCVVNNQRISVTQRQSVLDALELSKRDKSAAEIAKILEDDKFNSSIYITLDTLHYLKKGGRLTPAVAAIGTLLRIKPVLQIQGEKLDTFAKARTTKQGKTIMMDAIKNDIDNRFKVDYTDMHLQIAHTENEAAAELLKDELLELYPGSEIVINPLSLSVSCHIGPGALAIAVCKKMNYDEM